MIEPTGHHVLIKPDSVEEKSKGGILVVSDEEQRKREQAATTTGVITAVGINAWQAFDDGRPWAKVGDHVYFTRHVSKEIWDGDDLYFLMSDDNVLAIIKED